MGYRDVIRDGARAADDILSVLAAPILKALDPLDPDDFLIIQGEIARKLKGVVKAAEAAALREAFSELDVDWANASDAQKEAAINAAKAAMAERPLEALPEIRETFSVTGKGVVTGARASAVERYDFKLGAKFNSTDKRVVDFSAKASTNYARDQYGVRSEALAAKARDIVSSGLRKGFDRYEIGKRLRQDVTLAAAKRSDAYWEMVAGAHANRARTYASLATYEENGVSQYQYEAVLDEVTTLQCRLLHGRTFSVNVARAKLAEPEELGDPEAVTTSTPWLGVERADGEQHVYYKTPDGGRVRVATVVESAMGVKDDPGSFRTLMSDAQLQARGVTVPPVHGNCRSTIVPLL